METVLYNIKINTSTNFISQNSHVTNAIGSLKKNHVNELKEGKTSDP